MKRRLIALSLTFCFFLFSPLTSDNLKSKLLNNRIDDPKINFSISISNISDAGKYKQLMLDATSLLSEVINSEEFHKRVLATNFDWENVQNGFGKQLTSTEVFNVLYEVNRKVSMDLYFKKMGLRYIKFWGSGTVGVTSLNVPSTITFTKDWVDLTESQYRCTLLIYASHIAHEYCHQKGFADKNDDAPSFPLVVPYANKLQHFPALKIL